MKRVVITGLGVISPLGNSTSEFWNNIIAGKSGAGPITKFDTAKFKTNFACEVKNFNPEAYGDRKEMRKYDLFTQYAIAASDEAIRDSGLDFGNMSLEQRIEVGVIWSSGNGGIFTFEDQLREHFAGDSTPRFNPFFIPKIIVDIAAGVISIRNKLHGPNYCPVSACASSNTAVINALDTIRMGRAKIIVAGGSEAAITKSAVAGFIASQALSKNNEQAATASRPFDKDRDGFVIGEGAGALILEELEHALQRGAKIYAEVAGGGMAADAYHLTGTPPDGIGGSIGIQKALEDAGISPDKVDYINAHATSTGIGDLSELEGIRKVFGNKTPAISATKSMTGHLLGAAGAIESIVCALAVKNDIIPATINLENRDEAIPAEVEIISGKSVQRKVNYALNNSFGFGGHTATSVFRKYTG
jgi:3-oxoacyl-[acyl-carrier-protein] synthase II